MLEALMANRQAITARQGDAKAYDNLLNLLPDSLRGQAKAALLPLLSSDNPQVQEQGRQMLAEYQRRQGPAAQQDLAYGQQQIETSKTQQAGALIGQQRDVAGMQYDYAQNQRAEQALQLDRERTRATVANMSMDNAAQVSQLKIQANQAGFTNESNLRQDFNKNPLVLKSEVALTSYQQLINALDQNNPTALGAAIVAITQVQEPGLATREDDRIRYSGSNPLITQLTQMANTAAVQGGIAPLIDQRMRALGTQLAMPHAENYYRVKAQYGQLALTTPGAYPERVTTGTGVDEALVQFLMQQAGGR